MKVFFNRITFLFLWFIAVVAYEFIWNIIFSLLAWWIQNLWYWANSLSVVGIIIVLFFLGWLIRTFFIYAFWLIWYWMLSAIEWFNDNIFRLIHNIRFWKIFLNTIAILWLISRTYDLIVYLDYTSLETTIMVIWTFLRYWSLIFSVYRYEKTNKIT